MKKLVVFSCILAMAAVGTQAYAQMFKKLQQSSRNFAQILRQEIQRKHPMLIRKPVVRPGSTFKVPVPKQFAASEQAVLTPIPMPMLTPISRSYVNRISKIMQNCRPAISLEEAQELLTWKWVGVGTSSPIGQAFYESESKLAQDLDVLYEGKGTTVYDPQGNIVRVYELPVDNILFKPVDATNTIKLTSADYFVVYNPDNQAGRLIKKTSETVEMYSDIAGTNSIPQGIHTEVSAEQAQAINAYLKEQQHNPQ